MTEEQLARKRDYDRLYRLVNRERERERKRLYRQKNREKFKARNREYRRVHKDEINARLRARRLSDPDFAQRCRDSCRAARTKKRGAPPRSYEHAHAHVSRLPTAGTWVNLVTASRELGAPLARVIELARHYNVRAFIFRRLLHVELGELREALAWRWQSHVKAYYAAHPELVRPVYPNPPPCPLLIPDFSGWRGHRTYAPELIHLNRLT